MKPTKERLKWEKEELKKLKQQQKDDQRNFRTEKASHELKVKTKNAAKSATVKPRIVSIYYDPLRTFGNTVILTTSDGIMKRLSPGQDFRYHSYKKIQKYSFAVEKPDGKGKTTVLKTMINKKFVTRITLTYDYPSDSIKTKKQICDDEKGMLPQENLPGLIAMWSFIIIFAIITIYFIYKIIQKF